MKKWKMFGINFHYLWNTLVIVWKKIYLKVSSEFPLYIISYSNLLYISIPIFFSIDSCAVYTKSHSREVCRSGGVEVVTISSIIGAIGSQEAIKILTHLYIPLDNTYVYNGISGVGGTYIL